jgi:hypothetical protein
VSENAVPTEYAHLYPAWSDEHLIAKAMDGINVLMLNRYNLFTKATRVRILTTRNEFADELMSSANWRCCGPRSRALHGGTEMKGAFRCEDCGMRICKDHITRWTYSGAHVPPDEERDYMRCCLCVEGSRAAEASQHGHVM